MLKYLLGVWSGCFIWQSSLTGTRDTVLNVSQIPGCSQMLLIKTYRQKALSNPALSVFFSAVRLKCDWQKEGKSLKNMQYLCFQHCSIIFSLCNYSSRLHFSSHFGSFFASRMPASWGMGAFSGGAAGWMWFNQNPFFPAEFLLANRKTPALTEFSD